MAKQTPGAGHNSGVAGEELKAFVERIERLEEEKKGLAEDIRDIYAEVKGRGYNTKVLRQIIARRKRDHADLAEEEAIRELYEDALGVFA